LLAAGLIIPLFMMRDLFKSNEPGNLPQLRGHHQ
jgi:hypothetical protein